VYHEGKEQNLWAVYNLIMKIRAVITCSW